MQAIATEVGYAETAFITQTAIEGDPRRNRVRYFSPIAEVPFCGHATIAAAVVLAGRCGSGTFTFHTAVGPIAIETARDGDTVVASFTSVTPSVDKISDDVLDKLLGLIGITRSDLHTGYPPRLGFAGNWHPILVFAERTVFDSFTFDPDAVRELMNSQNWTTITTMRVISATEFEARNLFPVGTITEDPATGSAAAVFGGYLRELALVKAPASIVIHQGSHVGRPSELPVDIPREAESS